MRRSKTISLAEALKDYVKEMNLEGKLNEVGLINSWEEVVGKAISSRTSKIYIKEGVFTSISILQLSEMNCSCSGSLSEKS